MFSEIVGKEISCGVNKIARIMRINNFIAGINRKHSYKKTKNDVVYISENILNREFSQTEPNKVWVSDIAYIYTEMGWAYLCVFLNLYSKVIAGWSVSKSVNTDLIL
ncbi:MAG: hypothetical protein JXK07_11110 [Spirochaetes bacterium]|nr:hypothetical protein [Spirochaetota bacterium]MBN2772399.1 hypothetical protein [Spirochaetota bacterium]